jgi:hypothetical protein
VIEVTEQEGVAVLRMAHGKVNAYAPRRRRPMKAIPTNCDAKEDRWCCAGFGSARSRSAV